MRAPRWTHSLKSRIVVSYSLILILGGLSTSTLGIYVTGKALMQQARQQVVYGLSAARSVYVHRLQELRQSVELVASSGRLQAALETRQPITVTRYLSGVRQEHRLDFLSVADATGAVIVRTCGPGATGDVVAELAPIARALQGSSQAGTEIVPRHVLQAEDPALAERASIPLVPTPLARPTQGQALTDGITLLQEIRQSRPSLPVIVTTAYVSMEPLINVLDLGHSGYLVKPFDLEDLAARIDALG